MTDGLGVAAALLVAGPALGAVGLFRPALFRVWTAPRDEHLAMVGAHRGAWVSANAGFTSAAVLTAANSSLPEVGGDAVEYADPHDVSSIASALERLLRSAKRRTELGELAREGAQQFSWKRFAEITLETLDHVARDG